MKTWYDLENVNDNLEKLIYPLEMDDKFDRGKVHEYESQVKVFQGSLSRFNDVDEEHSYEASSQSHQHLELPRPNGIV